MVINKKTENLPFEIDDTRNRILIENHLTHEKFDTMFSNLIINMNNAVKLSEMEIGKTLRTASIGKGVDTNNGIKDMIMYVFIENIGKPNGEENNQLEGTLLNIEFVEEDEVTDTYLDFMNMIKGHYLEKSNHPGNKELK